MLLRLKQAAAMGLLACAVAACNPPATPHHDHETMAANASEPNVVTIRDETMLGGWWAYNPLESSWPDSADGTILECWAPSSREAESNAKRGEVFSAQSGGGGAYCAYKTL